MAPIFTAKFAGSSDTTPPLFVLRGAVQRVPAPPSSLSFLGFPWRTEIAYNLYKSNIDVFVGATMKQTRYSLQASGISGFTARSTLPLVPPPVKCALARAMPTSDMEKITRKIGGDASFSKSGNTWIFTSSRISPEMSVALERLSKDAFLPGRGHTTPVGLRWVNWLYGAISEFLATNTYPAYSTPFRPGENEVPVEIRTVLRKTSITSSYTANKSAEELPSYSYSAYLEMEGENVLSVLDLAEGKTDPMDPTNINGYLKVYSRDTRGVAKPSPGKPENNFGVTTKIPEIPGLVFPYFHGLVNPDHVTIERTVFETFFRLLGSNREKCQAAYREFRGAVKSFYATDAGLEITHILLGVRLTLETQSRLFLIIDGSKYCGFALLGSGFSILDNSKWISPTTSEHFRNDIADMDPHTRNLRILVEKFGELRVSGLYKGMEDISGPDLLDLSRLPEIFGNLEIAKLEAKDVSTLDSLFRGLNFRGDGYRGINPQNVAKAISDLLSSDDIPLEIPTYIPSIKTDLTSRTFRVLSRFGPEAPSLWNEKGTEYPIQELSTAAKTGDKRKADDPTVTFGLMPPAFYVTPKPLAVAMRDWEKVVSKKSLKMDMKERARAYRTMEMVSEKDRQGIWVTLLNGLKDVERPSKKRKVDSEEDDKEKYEDIMKVFE